jgi:hypothetical protein
MLGSPWAGLWDIHLIFFQVIAAEGEQKASKALRQAADIIADSHSALQVRTTTTCIIKSSM